MIGILLQVKESIDIAKQVVTTPDGTITVDGVLFGVMILLTIALVYTIRELKKLNNKMLEFSMTSISKYESLGANILSFLESIKEMIRKWEPTLFQ